jgi:hypothetical protein
LTPILIAFGAPNAPLDALLRALDTRGVALSIAFDLGSMFERLREATQHRAQVWQGVGARPAEWIDPALARFAPLLVEALAQRARQARGAADAVVAFGSPKTSAHALQLARLLPKARWLALVADGTRARASDEASGFEWAQSWIDAVAPARALGAEAPERIFTLRAEDFEGAPERGVESVAAWLGAAANAAPLAAPPRSALRLVGAALRGFAAHPQANEAMRELGYELPGVQAPTALPPAVAARRVRRLVELGRLELAERELSTPPTTAAEWLALGKLRAAQGRTDDAAAAHRQCVQLDESSSEAFAALFDASRVEALALAPRARVHSDVRVRFALARWLVRRGLDAEAAEIVASVEHQAWR